jgi:hypothetical protein
VITKSQKTIGKKGKMCRTERSEERPVDIAQGHLYPLVQERLDEILYL